MRFRLENAFKLEEEAKKVKKWERG